MRRCKRFMAGAAVAVAVGVGVPAAVATAAPRPYCGLVWGSQLKAAPDLVAGSITGVRAGRHECFDRLVIDVSDSPAPGFFVRYTNGLHAPGSGDPLTISGGAVLTITALAPTYDDDWTPTVPWRPGDHIARLSSFTTFRDAVYAGSFEGEATIGLGVRARLPFRVLKLENPSRLVIDVAHRW